MKGIFLRPAVSDVIGVMGLVAISLCAGMILNHFRSAPLPLTYESKERRLAESLAQLTPASAPASSVLPKTISLGEFEGFVKNRKGWVLDARPEIFYRLGHIPRALSLPRDSFKERYEKLRTTLEEKPAQPIAVYCSGDECADSTLVQQALERLGYSNVTVYRGGWAEWTSENLPTVTE